MKKKKNIEKTKKKNKTWYWLPRILAIVFILFVSIFALDVFMEDYTLLETIVALFMHLIPTFVLIAVTILAWKKEFAGGIAFIILGLLFTVFFNTYQELVGFLIISLPVFVIGILFLISHKLNKKKVK